MSGTQSVSSAEPEKLFRYASFGLQLDRDLTVEASRLGDVLQQFEASCIEPGFQIRCSDLASSIRGQGGWGETVDNWVRQVGMSFQLADSLGLATNLPSTASARLRLRQLLDPIPVSWKEVEQLKRLGEYSRTIVSGVVVAMSLRPGSAYVG